jgi:hypothetical protein
MNLFIYMYSKSRFLWVKKKQLANCLKRAETDIVLSVLDVRAYNVSYVGVSFTPGRDIGSAVFMMWVLVQSGMLSCDSTVNTDWHCWGCWIFALCQLWSVHRSSLSVLVYKKADIIIISLTWSRHDIAIKLLSWR